MRVFRRIKVEHEDVILTVFAESFQDAWIRVGQPGLDDPDRVFVIIHHPAEDVRRHFRLAEIRRNDATLMRQIAGIVIRDLTIDKFLRLIECLCQFIIAVIRRLQDRRSRESGPVALFHHICMDVVISLLSQDCG